jgi:ribosomal-protein-serine acetyltransferase
MLEFRTYQIADAPALLEAVRESHGPEFVRWAPWCRPDYRMSDSLAFIERQLLAWSSGTAYSFALFTGGDFVGGCGLNQIQPIHGYANLGYWVRRSAWGRNIAVQAVTEVAGYAFTQLKLNRVELVIPVGNHRSVRVAEKAGAVHEGVLRNRLLIQGQLHSAHMFSLIPSS